MNPHPSLPRKLGNPPKSQFLLSIAEPTIENDNVLPIIRRSRGERLRKAVFVLPFLAPIYRFLTKDQHSIFEMQVRDAQFEREIRDHRVVIGGLRLARILNGTCEGMLGET